LKIPKAQKRQSSHQYFFVLLGSAGVKNARKTLIKLTPERNACHIPKIYTGKGSKFSSEHDSNENKVVFGKSGFNAISCFTFLKLFD